MDRFYLHLSLWILLSTGAAACSSAQEDSSPCPSDFSNALIAQLQQKPKQTPAAEITQYTYRGQTVYLVTGGSANNYSYLFDTCGNVLCAAAGGPTNTGDGRCADFATAATNPVLVWRDPR